jgi:uncharacterized damage-inducible protein DinB
MASGMMTADPSIPRDDPDLQTGELAVLGQYLDYHRATLAMKCARLSEADLKRRAIPTSNLTLLGLVRHLTEVEYGWFCEWLDGQPERAVYFTDDDPDGDFDDLESHPVADVWTGYAAQLAESRRILSTFTDGGELARGLPSRSGRPRNVRWILAHMVEEYARHNGHADLLREAIDGETGE